MSSDPGSPCASPEEGVSDVENAPPEADDEEMEASADPREFLVFYQKKYYAVPASCVLFDGGLPLVVESGQAMGVLHECKSFPVWVKAGAGVSHMVLLEADVGGGATQRGIYVTFRARGCGGVLARSPDSVILRALHKSIAKKYYEQFQADWTDAQRERWPEIIAQVPPGSKQISPVSCHWHELTREEEPQSVLYRRKPGKKKDDEDEDEEAQSVIKHPPKKKPKSAPAVPLSPDGDDDQDSEPQSMALVPRVPAPAGVATSGSGGFNFFAQTPGMITVDLEEWRKLNAFYYSNGGR